MRSIHPQTLHIHKSESQTSKIMKKNKTSRDSLCGRGIDISTSYRSFKQGFFRGHHARNRGDNSSSKLECCMNGGNVHHSCSSILGYQPMDLVECGGVRRGGIYRGSEV